MLTRKVGLLLQVPSGHSHTHTHTHTHRERERERESVHIKPFLTTICQHRSADWQDAFAVQAMLECFCMVFFFLFSHCQDPKGYLVIYFYVLGV